MVKAETMFTPRGAYGNEVHLKTEAGVQRCS